MRSAKGNQMFQNIRRIAGIVVILLISCLLLPASAVCLDVAAVNNATWSNQRVASDKIDPLLIKAQILLDRQHFSPGEIDGRWGDNLRKALQAFASKNGLSSDGRLNEDVWQKLNGTSSDPALIEYQIEPEDVSGPFIKKLPSRMEEMKDLPALGYTGAEERIAEKFQMSQDLLDALNPNAKFTDAGTRIVVANVRATSPLKKAARLEVDKTHQTLRAFDHNDKFVAFFPITAGSTEKPAPSGQLKVTRVTKNPTYRYNPEYRFKGVRTKEPFTIQPGPNNPVGLVWIGLSAAGYGIHGTPDASKISKSESHGCIRLTNWDALKLAGIVGKGVKVDFLGEEKAVGSKASGRRRK
jgi:lipoprotein-anchoring transpeptidase ErfK/SrfK